jgi:hypothetical protein
LTIGQIFSLAPSADGVINYIQSCRDSIFPPIIRDYLADILSE